MVADTIRSRIEWKAALETADRLSRKVQPRWPHDAPKFLDLERWLEVNLKRAAKLGLIGIRPLKILDLGSGTGQFLFVCETLGHDAIGLDLPAEAMETPEREIFTEMPAAFGVRVIRAGIGSFQPLEVNGKFDLITSFMVCFNNLKLEEEWTLAEWKFFVEDMLARLRSGGRLALRLNHNEPKFGPRGYLDRSTHDYFSSIGSIDDGKIIVYRDSRAL